MRVATVVLAGLLVFSTTPSKAQLIQRPQRGAEGGTVLTINPLGFLQFGPNLEVQPTIGRTTGIGLGVRIPYLGLLPHLIAAADPEGQLGFTWLVTTAVMFYPQQHAPRGWFFGPRFEIGKGSSSEAGGYYGGRTSYSDALLIGAAEFGYRWIRPSGFNLSLGGQAGVIRSKWTNKDSYYSNDTGTDVYPYAMLVLGLGVKF